MRWRGRRRSQNIEDRRGRGVRRGAVGGLGGLLIILVALFLGVDPGLLFQVVEVTQGPVPESRTDAQGPRMDDELAEMVGVVLADTEETWGQLFSAAGRVYREPRLVLFTGNVSSACGFAQAAMGPFYCPGDSKVYIDLSFYDDLGSRFGAPGDFAQAYVIAHEVGHHVQNLLGISGQVQSARRQMSETEANAASVRLELQADCLAGVWAHHADRGRQLLEAGDLEEGLRAASAIGDDRLQQQSRGYVTPDSFTHGSSVQRVRWFETGFQSGDTADCDTCAATRL